MKQAGAIFFGVLLVLAPANRAYADAYDWAPVGMTGVLNANMLCTSDGSYINCATAAVNMASQVTGTLALVNGGTGAGTAAAAMNNLLSTPASGTYALSCNGTGCTPVAAGSGTVNSGTQYQITYYSATGTAVSGDANLTTDANSNLIITETSASPTLTDYTTALTKAGINLVTNYTSGDYTPGLFWSTSNDNATKPKAGIWMYESGGGTSLNFGTSNTFATGITERFRNCKS